MKGDLVSVGSLLATSAVGVPNKLPVEYLIKHTLHKSLAILSNRLWKYSVLLSDNKLML